MSAHAEIIGTLAHILTSIFTDKVRLSLQEATRRLPEPGDLAYQCTRLLAGLRSDSSLELEEQEPPAEESAKDEATREADKGFLDPSELSLLVSS